MVLRKSSETFYLSDGLNLGKFNIMCHCSYAFVMIKLGNLFFKTSILSVLILRKLKHPRKLTKLFAGP